MPYISVQHCFGVVFAYDKEACAAICFYLPKLEQGAIHEARFYDRHVDMICVPCAQTQTHTLCVVHVSQTLCSYF